MSPLTQPLRAAFLFLALITAPLPLYALDDWLQAQTDGLLAEQPDIPAVAIAVVRDGKLIGNGASGFADPDDEIPMSVHTPLRIASVTKTYVAATLLMLANEQQLSLTTPISALLPEAYLLPLRDAGYDVNAIQLHHLLSHTGGLRDHSKSWWYLLRSVVPPAKKWQPLDTVEIMAGLGAPLNLPGLADHYSDTGYVLLGQVIENLAGVPLHRAVRATLNLDALPLQATWWEEMEKPPAEAMPRAMQYYYGLPVSGLNATMDLYGGGGLMASTADMALFLQALFAGQVLRSDALLETMIDSANLPAGFSYHYGIKEFRNNSGNSYGHSGFWGTAVFYYPALNVAIAGSVTEKNAFPQLFQLIRASRRRLAEQPTHEQAPSVR